MFVIAGATGHVGSKVARELLDQKQKVKVIVRDAAKGAEWVKRGAEIATGSLEDPSFLPGALRGAKALFVLLPPNYTAPDFFGWQRKTADTVAGAVKAAAVPHVVMLSSVGADLAEGTGPIKGLHYLENALRAAGTTLTAIRAGFFQENVGMNLAPARTMGIYPAFFPADAPFPQIATKDIARLATQSLVEGAQKNEVIDIHGPAYSIRQLAEKLGKALGKTLQIVDVPQAGWRAALMQGGFSPHVADVFVEMYTAFATGIIKPKGDRTVQGKTEIDEVIKSLV